MDMSKIKVDMDYKCLIISECANTLVYISGREILNGYFNNFRTRLNHKSDLFIIINLGAVLPDSRRKNSFKFFWKSKAPQPIKGKGKKVSSSSKKRINFKYEGLSKDTNKPTMTISIPKGHKFYDVIKIYGLDIKLEFKEE